MICGKELTVEQRTTCSISCRNKLAGKISANKNKRKVDWDWLAYQYLLPPDGLGKSLSEIAKILDCTPERVQQIVASSDFKQNEKIRREYFRKRQVHETKQCPDVDKLATMYRMPPHGYGMTGDAIAIDFGTTRQIVTRWLREQGLHQEHSERQSLRMMDSRNPAYKEGGSANYRRKKLAEIKSKRCSWCGYTNKVEVHHINHDRCDNRLDNLDWLCKKCNLLESRIWQLEQTGRMDSRHIDNTIVLTFTEA